MNSLEGHYFDGRHPIAVPAVLDMGAEGVILNTAETSEFFSTDQLKVSPRIGRTERFISFPNGCQFGCPDSFRLDRFPQESITEGFVAWLEQRLAVAVASVAIIFATLVVGYFFGLPVAAKHIAMGIPMETERALGIEVLSQMDERGWLKETDLESKKQIIFRRDFAVLIKDLPFEAYYDLQFRSSRLFGPNAFALPGAVIIMTDEMVALAETEEELLAVLAHEIGHVEMRHATRSVLQNSVIGVVAVTVTGDAATLSGAVASLPMLVAQTKYSREFESEADDFAFRLLRQKGYSANAFADLMERLSEKSGLDGGAFPWISSHPVTSERIAQARQAAAK